MDCGFYRAEVSIEGQALQTQNTVEYLLDLPLVLFNLLLAMLGVWRVRPICKSSFQFTKGPEVARYSQWSDWG